MYTQELYAKLRSILQHCISARHFYVKYYSILAKNYKFDLNLAQSFLSKYDNFQIFVRKIFGKKTEINLPQILI